MRSSWQRAGGGKQNGRERSSCDSSSPSPPQQPNDHQACSHEHRHPIGLRHALRIAALIDAGTQLRQRSGTSTLGAQSKGEGEETGASKSLRPLRNQYPGFICTLPCPPSGPRRYLAA